MILTLERLMRLRIYEKANKPSIESGKYFSLKALEESWCYYFNFTIQISHYFVVRVNSTVNYIFLCLEKSLNNKPKVLYVHISLSELSCWIYAQEALKRHFIMVQGYSALKNLIYSLLPVQRGRRVEALKESRAQCEHTECIYSGIDGRWDEV